MPIYRNRYPLAFLIFLQLINIKLPEYPEVGSFLQKLTEIKF